MRARGNERARERERERESERARERERASERARERVCVTDKETGINLYFLICSSYIIHSCCAYIWFILVVHTFWFRHIIGSQNWPLRGGKGAYYQGGVRGTAWIHGDMLSESIKKTTTFELMHVTDLLPTLVGAAGGDAVAAGPSGKLLDGVNQWPLLTTDGGSSARADLLVNIEREVPTTAPPAAGTAPSCRYFLSLTEDRLGGVPPPLPMKGVRGTTINVLSGRRQPAALFVLTCAIPMTSQARVVATVCRSTCLGCFETRGH